jgi:hypothetical protein
MATTCLTKLAVTLSLNPPDILTQYGTVSSHSLGWQDLTGWHHHSAPKEIAAPFTTYTDGTGAACKTTAIAQRHPPLLHSLCAA